jgi:hypothetical protein
MNEEKELTQILTQTELMTQTSANSEIVDFELFESWVDAVSSIYAEYLTLSPNALDRSPVAEKPLVAIVDFTDKGSPLEFEVFVKAFIKKGYRCQIVDPRELRYNKKENAVYAGTEKIDIVYRRLVTKDMMDHYEEIPDFTEGIIQDAFCLIGPIKSQIAHTKVFFEVLHDPILREFLSDAQCAYIDRYVPFTTRLKFENSENNKLEIDQYCTDKDTYIIKPIDYYASKGVCAGSDYSKESWKMLLKEKAQEGYIIQKYCPLALTENIYYDPFGNAKVQSFRNITGMFVYNEDFAGIYSRAGLNAIISGLHDGFTLSSLMRI